MRYLGLDVHTGATVWCLLDGAGEVAGRGKVATTAEELTRLVEQVDEGGLTVGQEVGTMSYFVHDVLAAQGLSIQSFNAHALRMIASSRKKTDKRDAYWIAKALQTGMTPPAVYIPSGQVRRLRQLLSQREALGREQRRWLLRARTSARAAGYGASRARSPKAIYEALLQQPEGVPEDLAQLLERYDRMHTTLSDELAQLEATIRREAREVETIERLQTIPAVGFWVAVGIYAWVGDVHRFPNARSLAAYAGLVPSVWQSGAEQHSGAITKQGSPPLRRMLTQAGHVLLWRCRSKDAAPLKKTAARVHTTRKRKKIAVTAAARHILRIAYYVMRDGTCYDPQRLAAAEPQAAE